MLRELNDECFADIEVMVSFQFRPSVMKMTPGIMVRAQNENARFLICQKICGLQAL